MANLDDPLHISSLNSTSTPLGSGASFNGVWEPTLRFASVDFTITGSASGVAAGTVFFEFSLDGSNADISIPLTITDINSGLVPIPLRMVLPYFRLRYTNGSTAQTTFKLTTIYHSISSIRLTRFLNQTVTDQEPIENVGAVIKGKNTSGTYSNIALDAGGNLPVSGAVSVSNFPATQNVNVTAQAITLAISAATLPLPINAAQETGGNLAAIKTDLDKFQFDGSGNLKVNVELETPESVSVSNFPATQNVNITGTITVPVSGTFFQATQPISVASLPLPTGAATETTLAGIKTDTDKFTFASTRLLVDGSGATQPISGNVSVSNFPATQPVSGTITADQGTSPWVISGTVISNIGTTNGLALDATLTNATQKTKIVDIGGTNVASVDAAGDVQVDVNNGSGAAAVNIQDGGNSITVDGTISAAQSGTWTIQPGNTPNTSPWLVEERAPSLATYSAAVLNFAPAATPTDIFTIYGSGTKTIKITRIEISATQNTAAIRDLVLIKRSATNTGGTSAAVMAVTHDSNNAGATATILSYTANPASLGASVGNIRSVKMDIPATNLVGSSDRVIWTFGDRPAQAITLRGTSQGIAINLNSVTSSSNLFDISMEFTEE